MVVACGRFQACTRAGGVLVCREMGRRQAGSVDGTAMYRFICAEVFGAVLLFVFKLVRGKMRGDSWSRLFVSPGESHVVVVVVVVLAMRVYLL